MSLTSGCNPFGKGQSIVPVAYGPIPTTVPAATGIGPISASVQSGTSANNRKVSLSVGNPTSQIKMPTTNGRLLFLSIQGQILSE